MLGLYSFLDWNQMPRINTAKGIYEKIIETSKSNDYNWIASASELVKVTESKDFPVIYSIKIKIAILNGYSKIISQEQNKFVRSLPSDKYAVYYAYNSLFRVKAKKAILARRKFLISYLRMISFNTLVILSYPAYSFNEEWANWITTKTNELLNIEYIDFDNIKEPLVIDFINLLNQHLNNEKSKSLKIN